MFLRGEGYKGERPSPCPQVWKCCNGDTDKGYGSKEARDILSERWGKGMAHPGGA